MDGWKKWAMICAVAAVGCRTGAKTVTGTTPATQLPQGQGSMLERAFGPKVQMPHGGMPQSPASMALDDGPKGPLKPETIATFAGLEVDAAFANEELSQSDRDRRIDESRMKFQKALSQDPKNLESLRGLGRLYTRLGDKDRAAQYYTTAMQHHPKNHQLAHEAALSFGRFEDWDKALALWQHAQSIDPENRKYPRMIGLACARLGRFEEGFQVLVKVLGEAEARMVMARELMEMGRPNECRQQVELAVKADPNFAPAVNALNQFNGVQQAGYQQP
jgi:tetratricopeptide (TPR) repeat protein